MSRTGPTPLIGNLAWMPFASTDEVEIFDRFNGVPSLGYIRAGADATLFWRAALYLSDISLWLYVNIDPDDLRRLNDDDDADLLTSVVFRSEKARFATVGISHLNRLVFEREWRVLPNLSSEEVFESVISFAEEALQVALSQDPPLPVSRRAKVERASEAIRHLLPT